MPCFHPITGYRSRNRSENGKWPIVFNTSDGYKDKPVTLSCGKCLGCQAEKVRQWAIRCYHESLMYENNIFLTLTFSDDKTPYYNTVSLEKETFTLFMKRLRKRFLYASDKGHFKINLSPHKSKIIRYFHCGEYGENFFRPHHHALIFNFKFPDQKIVSGTARSEIYRSDILESLWPYGYSSIGAVNYESCAYCAKYIVKKVYTDEDGHYDSRLPEYATMSRRPGIGKPFYEKYKKDVYVKDKIILKNNLTSHPPKYYDKLYEKENPWRLEKLKERRRKKCK